MADSSKPWRESTFVAFDTETSGKYPLVAEIVEIAAVKWISGQIAEKFQTFVRPNEAMGEQVINIHHITNEMVADAPTINDVLPRFNSFIGDSFLIAHHAPFDLGFLAWEYDKLSMPLPQSQVLDSCILAQLAFPESINHRLITLVTLLGIHVDQAHRALDDSIACLEVALKCMERLNPLGPVEAILEAQGGALLWPRFSVSDLTKENTTATLVEGSKKRLVLEITYQGGSRPGVPRRITPQGLVRNPKGDYIVGLCHIDNFDKRFYLNRISTARILD